MLRPFMLVPILHGATLLSASALLSNSIHHACLSADALHATSVSIIPAVMQKCGQPFVNVKTWSAYLGK